MYNRLKRVLDFSMALILGVLSLPLVLFMIIYLALRFKSSPMFFQERIGFRNKVFTIWKFRSMPDSFLKGVQGKLSWDFQLIRDLGLDEIPQIAQILMGKMSFIGPRPLLKEYLEHYSVNQIKRHDCLPGIIGLAQVKGGNRLNWTHRLRYDTFYATKKNFVLDLMILRNYLKKLGIRSDRGVYPRSFSDRKG